MKRLSLLMMASLAATAAVATTYVRVEKDGTKTYSDRPLPGGQPVEVQPAQTYSTPKPALATSDANLPAEQRALRQIDDFSYNSCTLSPENDATFTNPESVTVSLTTDPMVRSGDTVNLVVDGKPAPLFATDYVLTPVDRGAHTAVATVKDQSGRVLCTASVTFHVFRPSVNMPRRN